MSSPGCERILCTQLPIVVSGYPSSSLTLALFFRRRHMALLYSQMALATQTAVDKKSSRIFISHYFPEDVALALSHLVEILEEVRGERSRSVESWASLVFVKQFIEGSVPSLVQFLNCSVLVDACLCMRYCLRSLTSVLLSNCLSNRRTEAPPSNTFLELRFSSALLIDCWLTIWLIVEVLIYFNYCSTIG